MTRNNWNRILDTAAEMVTRYWTAGHWVTLRQLFYRLVAVEQLRNTESNYKQLSSRTAKARRAGEFPALIDQTRSLNRPLNFTDPAEATDWLFDQYRVDRTEGQQHALYIAVEKRTLTQVLDRAFGDLGFPAFAFAGYPSQTLLEDIEADIEKRPDQAPVLIYAGDFDATGVDIPRLVNDRIGASFHAIRHVALDPDQIRAHNLPPQPGKTTDSRAAGFVKKYGELVQVELDALPPEVLVDLYATAIDEFLDRSTFEAQLDREANDLEALRASL